MRILYIGNLIENSKSGADIVNKRNIYLLNKIADGQIDIVTLSEKNTIIDKLRLYLSGLTSVIECQILVQLAQKNYDYVFLSQSLLGRLAKTIKSKYPSINIICCYHNIEKRYAREFIRVSGWTHLPFYISAVYNERLATKYCDYNFVLNERDSRLYRIDYQKEVDLILPVACEDTFDKDKSISCLSPEIIYLFVGVAFFANVEGVRWFISNVLPHVPGRLIIAGKGMELFSQEFESERVKVMGYVPDLSELYYSATFVVSPILSGGGMKTKTAEALMYGKIIIGTQEAFEGYVLDERATLLCDSAQQFINTINMLIANNETKLFCVYSRTLFIKYYSYDASFYLFRSMLEKPSLCSLQ